MLAECVDCGCDVEESVASDFPICWSCGCWYADQQEAERRAERRAERVRRWAFVRAALYRSGWLGTLRA